MVTRSGSGVLVTPGARHQGVSLMRPKASTPSAPSVFDRSRWLAAARARNRAFVDEVNARTGCVHCGAQPIEWHNPEHVERNRKAFRISSMRASGVSIEGIQAEMDRCTPLCRRCHMAEDGRLSELRRNARLADDRRAAVAPKPCGECGRPYKPLSRGLCKPCYRRLPDQIEKTRAHDREYARRKRAGGLELPGLETS